MSKDINQVATLPCVILIYVSKYRNLYTRYEQKKQPGTLQSYHSRELITLTYTKGFSKTTAWFSALVCIFFGSVSGCGLEGDPTPSFVDSVCCVPAKGTTASLRNILLFNLKNPILLMFLSVLQLSALIPYMCFQSFHQLLKRKDSLFPESVLFTLRFQRRQ